jgi:hypothetical protein
MPFFLVYVCLFVCKVVQRFAKGTWGMRLCNPQVYNWDAIYAMAKILGFQPSDTTSHELLSTMKDVQLPFMTNF